MKVVARERLFTALRAEEEKTLELAAIAEREDVAISAAKKQPRHFARVGKTRRGEDQRRVAAHLAEITFMGAARNAVFRLIDEER